MRNDLDRHPVHELKGTAMLEALKHSNQIRAVIRFRRKMLAGQIVGVVSGLALMTARVLMGWSMIWGLACLVAAMICGVLSAAFKPERRASSKRL